MNGVNVRSNSLIRGSGSVRWSSGVGVGLVGGGGVSGGGVCWCGVSWCRVLWGLVGGCGVFLCFVFRCLVFRCGVSGLVVSIAGSGDGEESGDKEELIIENYIFQFYICLTSN